MTDNFASDNMYIFAFLIDFIIFKNLSNDLTNIFMKLKNLSSYFLIFLKNSINILFLQ